MFIIPANQRNIFGTQFLPQFISLLSQFLSFYEVFALVDLVMELDNFAIGLVFKLVAADDSNEILCL